jgi:hypothetical protein
MKRLAQFEDRASRSRSKHEGESSSSLCDRLSRTRDFSQRQLPTDQDYAVSTREYQTDQSSLKPAPAAAGPVLEQRQRQQQNQPHRRAEIDGLLHIRQYLAEDKAWPSHNPAKLIASIAIPLIKGGMRVYSTGTQAQTSTTAASWSHASGQ